MIRSILGKIARESCHGFRPGPLSQSITETYPYRFRAACRLSQSPSNPTLFSQRHFHGISLAPKIAQSLNAHRFDSSAPATLETFS